MSGRWREDDDEEYRVGGGGGGRGGSRSKPRFSFTEIKLLLEEVKRNRFIILKKFNHGVSAETKKQTWAEITEQINDLGENRREVRQIMKKWADLKCDGKRRMVALRGPNGSSLRKKNLGPVERMVHKILLMSPGGDHTMDFDDDDDDDDSMFAYRSPFPTPTSVPLDPLPDDALLRTRPVHTYSRSQGHASSKPPPPAVTVPLQHQRLLRPRRSPLLLFLNIFGRQRFYLSPGTLLFLNPSPSSSLPRHCIIFLSLPSSLLPPNRPSASSSSSSDPLPAGASSGRPQDHVAQLASQSLQQQQAGRLLLASVSQSLETLAQSVQLLVESQQEFVQESLTLQRETIDILRDFSNTALAMLREKANSGQAAALQRPASQF
uniref:uncharacterized protein n=1 Tax=Centroberyx gerrardi TaxID=166262 RepID=UPI003AAD1ACA